MRWFRILSVAFILSLSGMLDESAQAQTIAREDAPYFMGRLKYSGDWGDTVDVSRFVDWRIDTTLKDDANSMKYTSKSPDSGMVWAAMRTKKGLGDLWSPTKENPFRHFEFRLMVVYWGIDALSVTPLTVWERFTQDSIRLICIDPVVSCAGIDEIRSVIPFPDSSILLFGGTWDWNHGSVTASDKFFWGSSPCHFETLYETRWRNKAANKTYVMANRLFEGRYRISEITEFLTIDKPDPRKAQAVSASPGPLGGTYDGTILDSAHIRVIDLWDLAKEKFGIDTTKLRK